MSKKYDVQKLKACIKSTEDDQRSAKVARREAQRALSAHDKLEEKDRSWKQRTSLSDTIGCRIADVRCGKETLTLLYMARASLRGRLHATKQMIHSSDGTKKLAAWTIESQAAFVKAVLMEYELPEEADAAPGAAA